MIEAILGFVAGLYLVGLFAADEPFPLKLLMPIVFALAFGWGFLMRILDR